MANDKPVTEVRLITILKEFSKDFRKEVQLDLQKLRGELRLDFQETLSQYREEEIIPRLDKINGRLDKIEQELRWIKQDIKSLKAESSTVVSMKNFASLRAKILSLQEELDEIKAKIGLAN